MSAHTPGPWTLRPITRGNDGYLKASEGYGVECVDETRTVCTGIKDKEDAHLIAAAPEMLAALEDVHDFLKQSGYRTDIVKQAIAKAKGES